MLYYSKVLKNVNFLLVGGRNLKSGLGHQQSLNQFKLVSQPDQACLSGWPAEKCSKPLEKTTLTRLEECLRPETQLKLFLSSFFPHPNQPWASNSCKML